jgi:hypothetical protein
VKRKAFFQACLSVVAIAFQNTFRVEMHQNDAF